MLLISALESKRQSLEARSRSGALAAEAALVDGFPPAVLMRERPVHTCDFAPQR
jgi:hypothetical protein